jgi:hypothetical protein
VNADRRGVATPQTLHEIVDFAHLIDDDPEMLVQCANDRVAFPLVVEAASFRGRDVHKEAHRRCGLGQNRRGFRRRRTRDIETALANGEIAGEPDQLPRQRKNAVVVTLDDQQRRRRIAARCRDQKRCLLRAERERQSFADPLRRRIQQRRIFGLFDGHAREPPKGVERLFEGRVIPPRNHAAPFNRSSGGALGGNLPLRPCIVFEIDRQNKCRKGHRLWYIGGSLSAALNIRN